MSYRNRCGLRGCCSPKLVFLGTLLSFLLMGGLFCGCTSSGVAWIETTEQDGKNGGIYAIESRLDVGVLKKKGVVIGEKDKNEVPAEDSALPVTIIVEKENKKDRQSAGCALNNTISVFTLGVWPYISASTYECLVTIKTPLKSYSYHCGIGCRNWSSFILPIAALPCPGWGDSRWCNYGSGGENVGLDEYKTDAIAELVSNVLTVDFYNREMGNYVKDQKRKYEMKKKVISKLQAILSETK